MLLQPKRYILAVLLSTFIFLACQFSALIAVDPLRLFHKPWIRDDYYISELRFQAAGIIRNTEFDSMILGTSLAANFSPREASKLWDAQFVNLSPDGSLLSERAIILKFALTQKRLKHVIISLDGFNKYEKDKPSFAASNFDYLYNENRMDDLKIYLNLKYAKYLLCRNIIISSGALCKNTQNLEALTEWFSLASNRNRFGGLNKWFEAKNNGQIKKALRNILDQTRAIRNGRTEPLHRDDYAKKLKGEQLSFDNYILHYISENPDTRFYLFFPPRSRMSKALIKKAMPDDYQLHLERIRYVVNALKGYPNAKVYGFDHLDFTNDIANYKDPSHYHPCFNSDMLRWMKGGLHELTSTNVEAYLKTISELAENYDILSFGKKIKSFMKGSYSGSE